MSQVKSKQRVEKFGEVFTSQQTVNEMLENTFLEGKYYNIRKAAEHDTERIPKPNI